MTRPYLLGLCMEELWKICCKCTENQMTTMVVETNGCSDAGDGKKYLQQAMVLVKKKRENKVD